MKQLLFVLIALALSVASRADLVVTQKVEGGGLEGDITIKFKERKVRADVAMQVSTIVDAATGETLVLQHRQRTFNRITMEQTKSLLAQMLKAQGASAPPKLTPTEEKREIMGHQTQAFLWEVGQMKMKFWVAKDYPNAAAIQQQLDQMQNSGLSSVAASMMPTPQQMPGVRMRTEMDLAGQKVNTTITAIKDEAVDPNIFKVPQGYKEVPLPVPAGSTSENE